MRPDDYSILIVDDEEVLARSIERVISHLFDDASRPTIHVVHTPDAAIAAVAEIDLLKRIIVISDYNLNGRMNGMQLLDIIKGSASDVQCVLMSGYNASHIRGEEFDSVCFDHFLPKPFDVDDLTGLVRRLMEMPSAS